MKKIILQFLTVFSICFLLFITSGLADEHENTGFEVQTEESANTQNGLKESNSDQQINTRINEISQNSKSQIEEQGKSSFGWGNYFQAIGIMIFLLILLWYILRLVRKLGNGRFLPNQKLLPKNTMYLEAQLPLGPNKYIALVKVLEKRLILGVTDKSITLIKELVEDEDIDYAKVFEEHLQKAEPKNS